MIAGSRSHGLDLLLCQSVQSAHLDDLDGVTEDGSDLRDQICARRLADGDGAYFFHGLPPVVLYL